MQRHELDSVEGLQRTIAALETLGYYYAVFRLVNARQLKLGEVVVSEDEAARWIVHVYPAGLPAEVLALAGAPELPA